MNLGKNTDKAETKCCVAVGCHATSEMCPYLFFLKVPQNVERRIDWCDAMGVSTTKGRLYCCTRHFDIPGDFDGDSSKDKSSGIRLKLKGDVLPHRGIPILNGMKNVYMIFEHRKAAGKIDKTYKQLLPAIEYDLNVKIPLTITPAALEKACELVVGKVEEYFSTDRPKSRYQLFQVLKGHRDAIVELLSEPIGRVQTSIFLRTIQPFLQYEANGCLDLTIDRKQLEQLYFECESTQLKACFRQPKSVPPTSVDENGFKDLFYMPGIRVNLTLPFLEMVREVISNSEKFVVNSSSVVKASELKPNGLEKFQKVDKPYRLKSSKVGQNTTLEYIDILIKLFESYEFMMSERQRTTLVYFLKQIRNDLSAYEMKELQVTYANYLSRYKYYRIINEDIGMTSLENNYMFVKEVINPELNFQFINAIDTNITSIEKIDQFFRPILGYINESGTFTDGEPYRKFADQLKKAITFTCQECNTTFDSPLAHLTVQEHRYCGSKKWKCTNCKKSFLEQNIAADKWSHACERNKDN